MTALASRRAILTIATQYRQCRDAQLREDEATKAVGRADDGHESVKLKT